MNTTNRIPPIENEEARTSPGKPDFRELLREALGYHGEVNIDHLLRLLPEWRPRSWFPRRWPDRVRRALRTDPGIEEVSPGMFRLRPPKMREPFAF